MLVLLLVKVVITFFVVKQDETAQRALREMPGFFILAGVWVMLVKVAIPVFAIIGIFASNEHWYFIAGIVMDICAGGIIKNAGREHHHSFLATLVAMILSCGAWAMIMWGGVRWLA